MFLCSSGLVTTPTFTDDEGTATGTQRTAQTHRVLILFLAISPPPRLPGRIGGAET